MRRGRPSKLRIKKPYKRKVYGAISKGAKSPKQIPAAMARNTVRQAKVTKGAKSGSQKKA